MSIWVQNYKNIPKQPIVSEYFLLYLIYFINNSQFYFTLSMRFW